MGEFLPDIKSYMQAGIDYMSKMPAKAANGSVIDENLSASIRMQMRILDEQTAVNRYIWSGIPMDLSSQEIERLLYYYGNLAFFYIKELEEFYLMPYTLNGDIDFYGRYKTITPVPLVSGSQTEQYGKQKAFLEGKKFKVLYDIPLKEITLKDMENSAVILYDYTKQRGETISPRQQVMDPLLTLMSKAFPMARTSLLSNCGVRGIRVSSEDEAKAVQRANKEIAKAGESGTYMVPIMGKVDFQPLTDGTALKTEEFLIFLQAADNYRLSLYGLENGGLFQKKTHMLEAEQQMNSNHTKLAYQDGLSQRQHFCLVANAIWGTSMWCEASDSVVEQQGMTSGYFGDEGNESEGSGESAESGEEE